MLIVDDGSIEKPSLSNLENKFNNIQKIYLIILEKNMGIDNALNKGLNFILELKQI